MGLFNQKKKRNEFDVLNGSGLIDFVRANLKNPTDANVLKAVQEIAKPNADQDHLTKDGNLPWGWYRLNKEFTDKIQGEYSYFFNEWIESRKMAPVKQYGALKSFVLYMNDAQKLCYSKGECFAYWFDGVASPDYIKVRNDELAELELNFNELQNAWENKQKEMIGLDERVVITLKENNGILQSDFVKMFDVSVRNEVKEKLYFMDKRGEINRIKSGRSCMLYIK